MQKTLLELPKFIWTVKSKISNFGRKKDHITLPYFIFLHQTIQKYRFRNTKFFGSKKTQNFAKIRREKRNNYN